jgi:outer membrane protein TolC
LIALVAGLAAAEPLSVEAAIARAIEANPVVEQSALAQQISEIQLTRARLDRYGLTLGALAGGEERVTVPLDGGASYDAQSASWDVRGTAVLPIYQGGAVDARIDQASANAVTALASRRITERDIAEAVVLAYWNLQGFDLQLEAAREALQVTRDALAIIEARAAAGLAAQIDVNRSKVDVFQQEAQFLELEQGRFRAREEIARLLHLASAEIALVDPVPGLDAIPAAPATGDGAARLELGRLASEETAAEAGVRLARSAALPHVSLTGDAGIGAVALGGGPDVPFPATSFDPGDLAPALDAGIGLSLSWTPFDLFRTRHSVEIAELAVRQAEAASRGQEDQIRQDVATAISQLETLRKRAVFVSEQLALARDNLQIIQDLYGQGNTTILELFDAQSSFRAARSQAASLAVDLVTAEWDVRFALGTDPVTAGAP